MSDAGNKDCKYPFAISKYWKTRSEKRFFSEEHTWSIERLVAECKLNCRDQVQ